LIDRALESASVMVGCQSPRVAASVRRHVAEGLSLECQGMIHRRDAPELREAVVAGVADVSGQMRLAIAGRA